MRGFRPPFFVSEGRTGKGGSILAKRGIVLKSRHDSLACQALPKRKPRFVVGVFGGQSFAMVKHSPGTPHTCQSRGNGFLSD